MKDFKYYLDTIGEVGYVSSFAGSIVYLNGLPKVKPNEVVLFENGYFGEVNALHPDSVEILLFSSSQIPIGTRVVRTNEQLSIPVGKELLGKIISPLIKSYKEQFTLPLAHKNINNEPLGIEYRHQVTDPMETGVTIVDMLVPIGKGQRQLILGDRKTGKSTFLKQTIAAQSKAGVICIYAAIGKKQSEIKELEEYCQSLNILQNVIIVASLPEDSSGLVYLTPYSAMAIAEYFRDIGNDVLIVFDDLYMHAKYCREIALLAKRFPGRNSYPVNIFFLHSKLLERAGNFLVNNSIRSITALPVMETTQGDISGYIQTNLISMTDGHVFFDSDLFSKGRRPAINPFLSVTRVGHQTQTQLKREISRELISFLTISEKLSSYTHFSAELNIATKQILQLRERIISFLDQLQTESIPSCVQVIVFVLIWSNIWNMDNPIELKQNITKIKNTYNTNQNYKNTLDDTINKATSFNALIR